MLNANFLTEMRRRGYAPQKVYIDLDIPMKASRLTPFNPQAPHLHIAPDENVKTIDMRCFKDLVVQIDGTDAERLAAVAAAVEAAQASRVITCRYVAVGEGEWLSFRIVEVTDTLGVVTWQQD